MKLIFGVLPNEEKILGRVEYVKTFGADAWSEETYQRYLEEINKLNKEKLKMKYNRAQWRIERNNNILKDKESGLSHTELSEKYFLGLDAIQAILGNLRGRKKRVKLEYCPDHPDKKTLLHHNICEDCHRAKQREAWRTWKNKQKKFMEVI